MTALSRAVFPLSQLSLPHQIVEAQTVIDKAKSSSALPSPDPYLTTLTTTTTVLGQAEQTVQTLKKQLTEAVDVRALKFADFRKACLAFTGHINTLAQGDTSLISAVGLTAHLASHPTSVVLAEMTKPLNLTATAGAKPGEVRLRWRRVKGAKSYVVQRSSDPFSTTSFSQLDLLTASKLLLEGQPSNVPLWYRVAAIGASGQGVFTDPVSVVAR